MRDLYVVRNSYSNCKNACYWRNRAPTRLIPLTRACAREVARELIKVEPSFIGEIFFVTLIFTKQSKSKSLPEVPTLPGKASRIWNQWQSLILHTKVSGNLVPLTVIKGAGHEFVPLPQGENATTADFHSIRTKTESPAYFTSGFYKIEAGPARPAHYTFEETKYVLNGQIDVLVCSIEAAATATIPFPYVGFILMMWSRTRLPALPTT